MKKTLLLSIITGIILSACFKPVDSPPLVFKGEANMTIAELQKFHVLGTHMPTLIDTAVIISGIITSTDQFGNCYKEIFFQDSTGGISIITTNPSYYMKYRIGQQIFVKAEGLYLGNYISGNNYGFYQLGLFGNTNGGLERISLQKENMHIFRSGVPDTRPEPKIIKKISDIVDGIGGDYHTLVTLEDCYFTQAGDGAKFYEERFVLGGASNQPIRFNGGEGEVVARISSPAYCSFANEVLPEGAVNITGLLTKFGNTRQFIICSFEDVEVPKILKSYDMNTDLFLEGWSKQQVKGTDNWTYSADRKDVRVQLTSENETECWLLSPKLNFTKEKNVTLCFTYRILNGTNVNAKVFYTTDGGKTIAYFDFTPKTDGSIVESVLKLDEEMIQNPNLQIVFHYKTTDKFPTWFIRNITFKANL